MLTSRQLAIVVWLGIFVLFVLVLVLAKKDMRPSILAVLKSLSSPKAVVLFATIIGYNIACTLVPVASSATGTPRCSMTRWSSSLWAVLAESPEARRRRGGHLRLAFYLNVLPVNLELMVVLLFLSDFFSLNFWASFWVVIPLTALVVMLVIVSGYQKGAEQAHRFLSGAQAAIGLLLIAYVVWRVVADYQDLLHLQVAFALGLPFVLSVLFVPLLLLTCAVFAYEDAFLVVSFKMSDDQRLARWKKRKLLMRFGLNLRALQGFRRSSAMQEYAWVKTKGEAQKCLV